MSLLNILILPCLTLLAINLLTRPSGQAIILAMLGPGLSLTERSDNCDHMWDQMWDQATPALLTT